MDEEKLKEAFKKVREDTNHLSSEIGKIKQILQQLTNVTERIVRNQTDQQKKEKSTPTQVQENPTNQQITPTDKKIPTHQQSLQAPESPNLSTSIGNNGVPTDRQTNQQTNQHINKFALIKKESYSENNELDRISQLQRASEILESLDELKKEVRFKFKRLTRQEMLIFTTIYQLDEQGLAADYDILAEKLKLSESSIRDYIGKIIKKGIPIEKTKESNKKVFLSISKELKKIASLNSIVELREL